ncbi:MAG: PD-(D/E)XK nuclease family protein [Nanoarchaeota archaeon]|nr:PD-(D/E)XK nuclease family protein [Nanoarchaeota archaeon]
MLLKEKNSHKRDKNIEFEEKSHTYYINGNSKSIISVTEFVHSFFPKFDADLIIKKMMNSRNWPNSKYYGMTADEIKQEWDDSKNLAARHGTNLHQDIEFFYNGKDVINNSREYEFFKKFHNDNSNLKPFRTEWCIYDENLKLAGTIDMVFCDEENNFCIYDWKRSKNISEENRYEEGFYPLSHLPHSNFWHYSLQLNVYKKILEEKYGLNITSLFLVCLHPNQENYIKIEVPNLEEEVIAIFEERDRILKEEK